MARSIKDIVMQTYTGKERSGARLEGTGIKGKKDDSFIIGKRGEPC